MADRGSEPELTDSLEDYLETVYELVGEKKFARVKDIAKARSVRPGSVSPAMRRLAEMGLIEYVRREYIGLTPAGERRARRILARHQLLCRLFEDILQLPSEAAEVEACAMEHSLSDEAMDRLVRFFEFLRVCPEADELLHRFHNCPVVQEDAETCDSHCLANKTSDLGEGVVALSQLTPGERAVVAQINGHGSVRQHLLDMGLMPDVEVALELVDQVEHTSRIQLQGFGITLTRAEAEAVLVVRK
jgi:DtxR family Mn-dependent transcriptional regulator